MLGELALLILQYLFDRQGKRVAITDLEAVTGKDIHTLRAAIEDLKILGYIAEDEYRIEIRSEGVSFARSRWV
ncbi:MAG: hypothetical protein LDLANPLL_00248 [Turneriella sp.]|nr:hypothetical protein [Turneriella sp.]